MSANSLGECVTIAGELYSLKQKSDLGICLTRIFQNGAEIGAVRLVSAGTCQDKSFLEDWVNWRKQYSSSYLTVFEPTYENAISYFKKVYLPDQSRFLFEFVDATGTRLAHAGLTLHSPDEAELGNVARSPKSSQPFVMYLFCSGLLDWARDCLAIRVYRLAVLENNYKARRLYERLGFQITCRRKLKRIENSSGYELVICEDSEETDFPSGLVLMSAEKSLE